ncbi:transcriptional regulator ATRX homolog [Euwallacea fornicatus]|uniref:transcriptional regulator ATRX homolog n=1 Tax=Euwallacea fornicatus TaxID=995702 RepID=UPI00338DC925
MSQDNEGEQLLKLFQSALNTLNKSGEEGLLARVEANSSRKELKKLKSLVTEVFGKANFIRESISKAYKKSKALNSNFDGSQSKDEQLQSDSSSKESDKTDLSFGVIEGTPEKLGSVKISLLRLKRPESSEGLMGTSALPGQTLEDSVVIEPPKDLQNENKEENKENIEKEKPKIKVIDIKKLMDPEAKIMEMTPNCTSSGKSRKSVTFDNSIIVLTSSDEDTPKKVPKQNSSTPLKGVLRKSKTTNQSDSDSDITKRQDKNKGSSESEEDLGRTRSGRKSREVVLRERFSKLVKERSSRQLRFRNKLAEDSSDEEELQDKRSKKRKKKELLEERDLSDGSLSSDVTLKDYKKASERRKRCSKVKPLKQPDINDQKLKAEVYISLPKFQCEDLPEIYRKKKEIMEIKNLAKLPVIQVKKASNFVGKEGGEGKKIKLTLKLNNKGKENSVEMSLSHEEESKDEEMADLSKEKENVPEESSVIGEGLVDLDARDGADTTLSDGLIQDCWEQIADSPCPEENDGTNHEKDNEEVTLNDEEDKDTQDTTKVKEGTSGETTNTKNKEESTKNPEEEKANEVLNTEDNSNKDDAEIPDSNKEEPHQKKTSEKRSNASSSDSDDSFSQFSKKKDKSKKEMIKEVKRRMKKNKVLSDSEGDANEEKGSSSGSEEEKKSEEKRKPSRKRIKRVRDSSSDEEDKSTRKHIRRMIDRDSLSETTKRAEEEEKMRKARILEKQKKYNQMVEMKADATVDEVVLDFDEKTNEALLSVDKALVRQLKPHQVQGIKFMWDASFESLKRAGNNEGSGCILAHCMGLGKTLQVITLVHTLLVNSEKTKVEKVLVVCPVNTVLNWKSEFKKWIPNSDDLDVYELVTCKTNAMNQERNYIVNSWHEDGGVLIIGYTMFRNLSNPDNKSLSKKLRVSFQKGLVDPGPDLVVCDEGHLLKNEKTNLSIAMNRIKTARRIVLTGTPLQNNLREYWCMVQFIKPNLLGTYKEYLNRFVNPITNGQYTDSTQHDIMIMRRRSHVLHKLLDGVVQRQDYAVLEPYLPPKHEYVLFLKLTEVQAKLYKHYLANFARRGDGSNRTSFLFTDFQELQRICTHPRVLLDKSREQKEKPIHDDSESEGSMKDFIDDGSRSDSVTSSSNSDSSSDQDSDVSIKSGDDKKKKTGGEKRGRTRMTRAQTAQKRENGELSESDKEEEEPKQWWDEYVNRQELDNINHSAKIFLLFQILKECEEIGDKVLVFSQSLYTLNCIEYFLARIHEATRDGDTERVGGHSGCWLLGLDYFRLDGSSSCDNRASWCDEFNDPERTRARLFLISTKAGGLGINLVAANRVIIFDVSWNPSHDIQSIYRVYRFGQTKPSYIYRFVTYGSMEMKIYERQVTKQAISKRVIDEQQIDRHYSQNDIQELYKTDLEPVERPIPRVPKDILLGEMLQKYDGTIFKYHEHQSLLENKQDEELNEDERKAAWEEFENEKVLRKTTVSNFGSVHLGAIHNTALNCSPQMIQLALGNIVRKDNPTWSDVQIKGILPALVTQLQMQMSENDFSMYNRVQQEVRLMQALHAQRMRQQFMNQYLMQKQQLANQGLGNLAVTPEEIRQIQVAHQPSTSDEVIDLND